MLHLLSDAAPRGRVVRGARGTDIRADNAAALRAKGTRDPGAMLRRCVGVAPARGSSVAVDSAGRELGLEISRRRSALEYRMSISV